MLSKSSFIFPLCDSFSSSWSGVSCSLKAVFTGGSTTLCEIIYALERPFLFCAEAVCKAQAEPSHMAIKSANFLIFWFLRESATLLRLLNRLLLSILGTVFYRFAGVYRFSRVQWLSNDLHNEPIISGKDAYSLYDDHFGDFFVGDGGWLRHFLYPLTVMSTLQLMFQHDVHPIGLLWRYILTVFGCLFPIDIINFGRFLSIVI